MGCRMPRRFAAYCVARRFRMSSTPVMVLWTTAPQDQYPNRKMGGYSTKNKPT